MPRFFVRGEFYPSGLIPIGADDTKHIRSVLRMRDGDKLTICNGSGIDYLCTLESSSGSLLARVHEIVENKNEPSVDVHLFPGLPKGDKAEEIVQKAVECGVKSVTFFPCIRSLVRLDDKSWIKKEKRLNKIAEEAAKQCGRGCIPEVSIAAKFTDGLTKALSLGSLNLFCYEKTASPLLSDALPSDVYPSYTVITGPEGGFDETEVQEADRLRFSFVGLGPRILRCQTAPIAVLTAIMYKTGNM